MGIAFSTLYDRGMVYAVVADPPTGLFGTYRELEEAAAVAHSIAGYVLALPVVADMRVPTWTENLDRKAYEQARDDD